MLYHIKRIDNDTIEHQIGKFHSKEVGISKIPNLQEHLQSWINQRKQFMKITKVTNDLGLKLK